jgi:superoxide dismutase, Cu-Zn family
MFDLVKILFFASLTLNISSAHSYAGTIYGSLKDVNTLEEEMNAAIQPESIDEIMARVTDPDREEDAVSVLAKVDSSVVLVSSTTDSNLTYGTLIFAQTEKGVSITGNLFNLPPGKHGFHIHENGSCADEGKAAGGHFNPDNVMHGHLQDHPQNAHAGDMGNIEVDDKGKASIDILLPDATLTEGKYNVSGKALIIHEKEDDFGQPTGNAGGRIGCGIINQK